MARKIAYMSRSGIDPAYELVTATTRGGLGVDPAKQSERTACQKFAKSRVPTCPWLSSRGQLQAAETTSENRQIDGPREDPRSGFLNRRSQVRFLPGALGFRSLFAGLGVDTRGQPRTGLDPRFGKLLASQGVVEQPV